MMRKFMHEAKVVISRLKAIADTLARRRKRTAAGLIVLLALTAFWNCLPDPLFDRPWSTLLLDRDGVLLGAHIAQDEQWRFPLDAEVPERYAIAAVHFEDRRFWYHPGVDPLAVIRATVQNLRAGRVVSGASTLSMQVIRLSSGNPPRTFARKLLEMIQALRLELGYSKQEILALYAAHAPYGGNTVGLQAASWRWFGRTPEQLTWAEAALLAVLPNNPALLHPGRSRDALRERRDALIRELHEQGYLEDLEMRTALAEPLPQQPRPLPRLAPHLLQSLRAASPGEHRFDTSIDAQLQKTIRRITNRRHKELDHQGIGNLAVVVLDNQSFEVLAYVGNAGDPTDAEKGAAVDIIQRPRSTGSILKPLLYATMLEHGELTPDTLVPDLPTQYAGYIPENYDRSYRGAVPARIALARSLNIPSVRMLKQHGVVRFYDYLRQMGITTLDRPPGDYGLTLILGGAEGSLWELTNAYANLAWLARHQDYAWKPRYRQASLLPEQARQQRGALAEIGPGAAWLTLQALLEVARPDSERYWRRFQDQRPVAWKTGTSYGLRDAWAIGTDARYTVGVWVGNANGEGRAGLSGLNSAAPVLFDVFNALPDGGWFTPPREHLREIKVCRRDGYLPNSWCETGTVQVPRNSHFARQTPYHRLVHLSADGRYQVHSRCEQSADMTHRSWFVLPSGQAYYYGRFHADYRPLPPYRQDCLTTLAGADDGSPIDVIYPHKGTRLYIPTDLGAKRSQTVFRAAHRDTQAELYWHLDDDYLGKTDSFHEMALDIRPGRHRLVLVDNFGNSLVRRFEVLSRD